MRTFALFAIAAAIAVASSPAFAAVAPIDWNVTGPWVGGGAVGGGMLAYVCTRDGFVILAGALLGALVGSLVGLALA